MSKQPEVSRVGVILAKHLDAVWLDYHRTLQTELDREVLEAVEAYRRSLDVPELEDFVKGAIIEAQHQRQRWGDDHDISKDPEEWFWLVGYLAGKGLRAQRDGDLEKFKHHLITGAAVLANWHARARADLERQIAEREALK